MMTLAFLVSLIGWQLAGSDASTDRVISQLPKCTVNVSAPIPTEWRRVELAQSVTLSIPADFARPKERVAWCLHGCDEWAKDGLLVAISYGIWAPSSFEGELWRRACVIGRPGVSVVVMESTSENSLLAWPRPSKRNHGNDTVVRVTWSTVAERQDVLRILGSIRK